jgi:hypothetical protein
MRAASAAVATCGSAKKVNRPHTPFGVELQSKHDLLAMSAGGRSCQRRRQARSGGTAFEGHVVSQGFRAIMAHRAGDDHGWSAVKLLAHRRVAERRAGIGPPPHPYETVGLASCLGWRSSHGVDARHRVRVWRLRTVCRRPGRHSLQDIAALGWVEGGLDGVVAQVLVNDLGRLPGGVSSLMYAPADDRSGDA